MPRSIVELASLFEALPELPELDGVRAALAGVSRADDDRSWEASSDFATLERRVVGDDAMIQALAEARAAARQRLEEIHDRARSLVEAVFAGDRGTVYAETVALGEAAASEGCWTEAVACFEAAAAAAARMADAERGAFALRKLARVRWFGGELDAALVLYAQSRQTASAAGLREPALIAGIGAANIRLAQGRFQEAGDRYRSLLAECRPEDERRLGEIYNNLATVARELEQFEEAREWLHRAEPICTKLDSPADRAIWWNNVGMLYADRGDAARAHAAYAQALDQAPDPYSRCMVLDNMAELASRTGSTEQALTHARRAEDAALQARSDSALAEVYLRLGRIHQRAGHPDGVAFFEKALALCAGRVAPLVEARATFHYGLFRRQMGDAEAGASLLHRAARLFEEIGAEPELRRVEQELRSRPG